MSFSSFYGGRIGASFIIVKRFNDISIEEGSEYAFKYYAYAADSSAFLSKDNALIEKTSENYRTYRWKPHILDGSTLTTKDVDSSTEVSVILDTVYAEGMVQCFSQGGDSTDEVNYGEYVIIDTLDKNNPNNGKVYRRGMNYIYSATDNPLAGAEYIGQIVGPQGNTPELSIDHYDTIIQGSEDFANVQTFTYDESNLDIIPGFEDGNYNDTIELVSANIQDEYGNIYGCVIGFKLPYLMDDYEARSMSPYENRAVDPLNPGSYYNYDLISEDENYFIDGKWVHPFYHKWQIKIPHGYHGINSTNIEIVHTKTMPSGFKKNFAGTQVYDDENCTNVHYESGSPLVLVSPYDVLREIEGNIYYADSTPIYDARSTVSSCRINYNDQTLYVKKDDCYMDVVRYRETNFDNLETGEVRYYYLGNYNIIKRITLSENGILTAFYSAMSTPQQLEEAIRWIDTQNTDGITIDNDGTVTIYYNTLDSAGNHTFQKYPKVLDWITQVTLQQDGKFTVLFNNDSIQNGKYETTVNWIDLITMEDDGTINCYYNSNHDYPAYSFLDRVKWIKNLGIETIAEGSTLEGTGDQMLHVTYNNDDKETIGKPINYIIETVISKPNLSYPNAPYSHLLVYYADPALRQSLSSKWITYPSTKYSGEVWTEWVDLGDVRGAAGGLHILEDVESTDELKDASGQWIPPEQLTDDSGEYINPNGAGWAVTVTAPGATMSSIYCYDYNGKKWYSIGTIDVGSIDPSQVIIKSAPIEGTMEPDIEDIATLKEGGFWLASEVAYCAY